MSNFYNTNASSGPNLRVMNMKLNCKSKLGLVTLTLAAAFLAVTPARSDDPPAAPKTAAKEKATDPLEPLAFLAGGEWEAKLPAAPDGSQNSIIARFSWANNHKAIRISNSFSAAGKAQPYIDGLYTWHPGKHCLVFWYVDGGGSLYEGTVKPENGVLIHEFQITDAKGVTTEYTSKATPDGASAWTNEIFSRKDGHLDPMVKVRYEKVK